MEQPFSHHRGWGGQASIALLSLLSKQLGINPMGG